MPNIPSPEEPASERTLFLRCKGSDKGKWVHAAGGEKLTDWVIQVLNKAAEAQKKKERP